MTTSLRSRLAEPGAIVALGAHDGLTARIAEASMPSAASTWRTHSVISFQLASVSNTWEPGTPSRAW
jgi:hypothetical protein